MRSDARARGARRGRVRPQLARGGARQRVSHRRSLTRVDPPRDKAQRPSARSRAHDQSPRRMDLRSQVREEDIARRQPPDRKSGAPSSREERRSFCVRSRAPSTRGTSTGVARSSGATRVVRHRPSRRRLAPGCAPRGGRIVVRSEHASSRRSANSRSSGRPAPRREPRDGVSASAVVLAAVPIRRDRSCRAGHATTATPLARVGCGSTRAEGRQRGLGAIRAAREVPAVARARRARSAPSVSVGAASTAGAAAAAVVLSRVRSPRVSRRSRRGRRAARQQQRRRHARLRRTR